MYSGKSLLRNIARIAIFSEISKNIVKTEISYPVLKIDLPLGCYILLLQQLDDKSPTKCQYTSIPVPLKRL